VYVTVSDWIKLPLILQTHPDFFMQEAKLWWKKGKQLSFCKASVTQCRVAWLKLAAVVHVSKHLT